MGEHVLGTIVLIVLLGTIAFGVPMIAMSDRQDDVTELAVQTAVSEFVNNSRTVGKITEESYEKLVSELYATGNTYDIVIEIQVLDGNPAKKNTNLTGDEKKIGENIYYSIYTTQVMDELEANGVKYMKEGDILKVSASNTNNTIAQMLKNFFYSLSGNDTYSIVGSQSGIVTVTGSGK